jgi:hypothetical protein
VTFIGDHGTELGFKVLPRGTSITEATINGRPAIVSARRNRTRSNVTVETTAVRELA